MPLPTLLSFWIAILVIVDVSFGNGEVPSSLYRVEKCDAPLLKPSLAPFLTPNCTCAKTWGYSCEPGFYCMTPNHAFSCTSGFFCGANTSQPDYCCDGYYCPTPGEIYVRNLIMYFITYSTPSLVQRDTFVDEDQ